MTYVNVRIDTDSERHAAENNHMRKAEIEFWRKRADDLQMVLDNIYEHASQHGRIELWRNGEKLVLVKPPNDSTR